MQAGGDGGRKREVWVGIGTGNPALDTQPRAVADNPEAAGPVVPTPHDRGGRERGRLVALVRVHERRVEEREVAGERDQPGEVVLEQRRHAMRAAVRRMEERLVALAVPQRRVQMEGA